jgi:hypothetical protein
LQSLEESKQQCQELRDELAAASSAAEVQATCVSSLEARVAQSALQLASASKTAGDNQSLKKSVIKLKQQLKSSQEELVRYRRRAAVALKVHRQY